MITMRKMELSQLPQIGEIDRSEEISHDYVYKDGVLELKNVQWSVPDWSQNDQGDHSVANKIASWRPWLEGGGTMLGAFDARRLVAFAIYRPHLSEGVAQFAVLHVSRPYRRQGLGAALAAKVIEFAKNEGATQLYVSSAPTKGTVEFYQSVGFRPTPNPDPDLFELEPEDIHMRMRL